MTDKKVMTGGGKTIELYQMRNSGHNDGLIMVYLPKQKILVQADAYNPAANPNAPMPMPPGPYTVNLVENLSRLNLDVQRIIPVHYPADNRQITMAELRKAVGQ
jgi:hypothetical protein